MVGEAEKRPRDMSLGSGEPLNRSAVTLRARSTANPVRPTSSGVPSCPESLNVPPAGVKYGVPATSVLPAGMVSPSLRPRAAMVELISSGLFSAHEIDTLSYLASADRMVCAPR